MELVDAETVLQGDLRELFEFVVFDDEMRGIGPDEIIEFGAGKLRCLFRWLCGRLDADRGGGISVEVGEGAAEVWS